MGCNIPSSKECGPPVRGCWLGFGHVEFAKRRFTVNKISEIIPHEQWQTIRFECKAHTWDLYRHSDGVKWMVLISHYMLKYDGVIMSRVVITLWENPSKTNGEKQKLVHLLSLICLHCRSINHKVELMGCGPFKSRVWTTVVNGYLCGVVYMLILLVSATRRGIISDGLLLDARFILPLEVMSWHHVNI